MDSLVEEVELRMRR